MESVVAGFIWWNSSRKESDENNPSFHQGQVATLQAPKGDERQTQETQQQGFSHQQRTALVGIKRKRTRQTNARPLPDYGVSFQTILIFLHSK